MSVRSWFLQTATGKFIARKTGPFRRALRGDESKREALLKDQLKKSQLDRPLALQLQFVRALSHIADDIKADCYISLLPSTLPAAHSLKARHGGKVVCDVVENVEVHKHSLAPRWDPEVISMVNWCAAGSIAEADGLMTVGHALEDDLTRFGKPILVLKNFRNFEQPTPDLSLRARCGIPHSDHILFASGNVVVGFEPVLQAVRDLPDTFHLVALVQLKPLDYEQRILALIREYGISHRVHILPFVQYEKLAATAAAADVGLITSDVTNPNGAVALPNRCFDYLTAGLPVVAPPMPDVRHLIDEFGFGRIVDPVHGEGWKVSIKEVVDNLANYRTQALSAREQLTWESQEEELYDFLGRPKSVTLLGFRDLSRYQRYKRLAASLQKRGCKVNKVFWSKSPDLNGLQDGVEHFWVRDALAMSDGIVRLGSFSNAAGE